MFSFAKELFVAWTPGLVIFALLAASVKLAAHVLERRIVSWRVAFVFALVTFLALAIGRALPPTLDLAYSFLAAVAVGTFIFKGRAFTSHRAELSHQQAAVLSAAAFVAWKVIAGALLFGGIFLMERLNA